MVLFLHDSSDTFLLIGRFYADLKNKNKYLLALSHILGFVSWMVLRMAIFPVCVIGETMTLINIITSLSLELQSAVLLPGMFMVLMMGALMLMHSFWTYFIFKAFFSYVDKKKVTITRNY